MRRFHKHQLVHVTRSTRDRFLAAVDLGRKMEPPFANFAGYDADLLDVLRADVAMMPADICTALLLPRGSSCGDAARELRRWLAAQALSSQVA